MKLKTFIFSLVMSSAFILPSQADSFTVKEEQANQIPTEMDLYNDCIKSSKYTYLPNPGEPQSSVNKKRAKIKAATEKKCKCTAPREYKLLKDVIGNDLEAFSARMQSDEKAARATVKKLTEQKRQIEKLCSK
ncbi:hypothetical protein ACON3F_13480 [Providencia hangzhouensis]|uniref:hypothetical protein n=2 Tax=Morganellaceae TaxID=1903414 RepID=UPI000D83259E|nr:MULTISPECIES: hypothetical protein [Providencia]PYZ58071.1 hypothetical protein DNK63_02640 [Providencia rettgeri]QIF67294.1 hypothetical protein FVA72_18045 [Providencia sp. 1709051003]WOB94601.1 hypothetical protein P3L54_17585 [Providencia sp. PROV099]